MTAPTPPAAGQTQPTPGEPTASPAWQLPRGQAPKKPAEHVADLKDLVVGYAKQETVDPLKNLGRYLGFGVGGALAIGTGVFLMLLGLLRGLQSIDVFNRPSELHGGTWSFAPYLITAAVGAIVIGLSVRAITLESKRRERTR